MSTLFISLLTLVLLLVSGFVVLIVLMQRTSQSGGMGAALGGGAAESAFGSETNSILMRGTILGIVAFFVVALGLYLLYQAKAVDDGREVDASALISAVEGEEEVSTEEVSEVLNESENDGTETVLTESVDIETPEDVVQAAEAQESEAGVEAAETLEPVEAVEAIDAATDDAPSEKN